jgi:hypothetical protein
MNTTIVDLIYDCQVGDLQRIINLSNDIFNNNSSKSLGTIFILEKAIDFSEIRSSADPPIVIVDLKNPARESIYRNKSHNLLMAKRLLHALQISNRPSLFISSLPNVNDFSYLIDGGDHIRFFAKNINERFHIFPYSFFFGHNLRAQIFLNHLIQGMEISGIQWEQCVLNFIKNYLSDSGSEIVSV